MKSVVKVKPFVWQKDSSVNNKTIKFEDSSFVKWFGIKNHCEWVFDLMKFYYYKNIDRFQCLEVTAKIVKMGSGYFLEYNSSCGTIFRKSIGAHMEIVDELNVCFSIKEDYVTLYFPIEGKK